jgi:hypothetical protein
MINYINELYYSIKLKEAINCNELVKILFENEIDTNYNVNKSCDEIIIFSVFQNENKLLNEFYLNNYLYGSNICNIIKKSPDELRKHYDNLVSFDIINPLETDYNTYLTIVNKVIHEYNKLLLKLTDDLHSKKGNLINLIEEKYHDNIKSKQWNERVIII